MDNASESLRQWSQLNAPEERLAKAAELAQEAFDTGVANVRELADLVRKANNQALDVISKRITESFDEAREYTRNQVR